MTEDNAPHSEEELKAGKLSTSRLAKKLGLKTQELTDHLLHLGAIEISDGQKQITPSAQTRWRTASERPFRAILSLAGGFTPGESLRFGGDVLLHVRLWVTGRAQEWTCERTSLRHESPASSSPPILEPPSPRLGNQSSSACRRKTVSLSMRTPAKRHAFFDRIRISIRVLHFHFALHDVRAILDDLDCDVSHGRNFAYSRSKRKAQQNGGQGCESPVHALATCSSDELFIRTPPEQHRVRSPIRRKAACGDLAAFVDGAASSR